MKTHHLLCLCLSGSSLAVDAIAAPAPPPALPQSGGTVVEDSSSPTAPPLFDASHDEAFLRHAGIVDMERLPIGVTRSHKIALSDGARTASAVWKTIDEYEKVKRWQDSPTEIHFSDSYRHEIAAYELDKLLGLGMVPPTVARRIRGDKGSLQLWLEGVMTESERLEQGLSPPDRKRWNEQMYSVRLFHRLTYNADHRNVRNLLVDDDFRIYIIDNSRAFRPHPKIFLEDRLRRFSRGVLEKLRGLQKEDLEKTFGPLLRKRQIEGLWKRRGLILQLAERRVAERGEVAVLFP
jgi:hypothetical protein